jgi:molecular chaperone DnaK
VAIRISRPQASEGEFLEQELDTITRTGVTLLGAQPRPQGVVLRFEIVLASGSIVMRGEGRVVAFKPNAHQGLGGLTLRFTRLDSKSKALVDKANALRESRRPSLHPSPPSSRPPPVADMSPSPPQVVSKVPPLPEALTPEPPSPLPPVVGPPPLPPRAHSTAPKTPPGSGASVRPPEVHGRTAPLPAPAGRDALLDRLRARAKSFDARAVEMILQQKPRG